MITLNIFKEIINFFENYLKEYKLGIKKLKPILFVIKYENEDIPNEILSLSDLFIKISYPVKNDRIKILEELLSEIKSHSVDITVLSDLTEGWNVKDIKKLIKVGYIKWRLRNYMAYEMEQSKNYSENLLKSENKTTEDQYTEKNSDKLNKEYKEDNKTEPQDNQFNEIQTEEKQLIDKKKGKKKRSYSVKDEKNINIQNNVENKNEKIGDENNKKEESGENQIQNITFKSIFPNSRKKYLIPLNLDLYKEIIENREVIPARESVSLNLLIYQTTYANKYGYLDEKTKFLRQEKISSLQISNASSSQFNKGMEEIRTIYNQFPINAADITSFTTSQLYQYAAANDYDNLMIILDKLQNGKLLGDSDRILLAKYSFILLDSPNTAISRLLNAKTKIDKLKKLFNN